VPAAKTAIVLGWETGDTVFCVSVFQCTTTVRLVDALGILTFACRVHAAATHASPAQMPLFFDKRLVRTLTPAYTEQRLATPVLVPSLGEGLCTTLIRCRTALVWMRTRR